MNDQLRAWQGALYHVAYDISMQNRGVTYYPRVSLQQENYNKIALENFPTLYLCIGVLHMA